MKKALYLLAVISVLIYSCTGNSSSTIEKTVKVWGNCEKCKSRIENACKINGVAKADWNIDSKLLVLKLDTSIVKLPEVLKSISNAGHDNESFFANDYAYSNLPESCQYERRSE